MKTQTLMFAIALAVPAAAVAQAIPSRDPAYRQVVEAQYCAKLREGPAAYAQFVNAKRMIHGYTYSDFAALNDSDAVKVDCKTVEARMNAAKAITKDATKVAEKASDGR